MKVVTINGQNHKGSTYRIGRMLAEKLSSPEDIYEVFLPRDMPHFCCGCTQCFMKDEMLCPHYKYLEPIVKKMDEADVLILTSPVYVYHVTGSMKAFLDHFGYRWMVHRPEEKMFRKQAVCITTAAGGGMKSACKDMKDSMSFWGIPNIYCYGEAVRAVAWKEVTEKTKKKIKRKVCELAAEVRKNHGRVMPGIRTKVMFTIMRMIHRKGFNEVDDLYWKRKGWLKGKRPWK